MITEETFAPLIETVPGFSESWSRVLREAEGEWYSGMAALAHYLVDRYASGSTAEFPEFFRSVEAMLQMGDEDLSGLLAIGLFEDMQSIASHRPFGYPVFEQWLGPMSLATWREIEAGMQKVAQWAASRYRQHWWQFWRPKRFNVSKVLSEVENPELRKIIESLHRKS